ncbi:hypothetical protein [Modestobacter marinus]|uniref:hypothetical protein n=1 Tax=Modestobacter marinus TaxID=477641 RepID=UPI001C95260E|nr:hypothetical protein [Modestobacter marinus]
MAGPYDHRAVLPRPCRTGRAGTRETHVLSVTEALAQFRVGYPFVDDAMAAELSARGG